MITTNITRTPVELCRDLSSYKKRYLSDGTSSSSACRRARKSTPVTCGELLAPAGWMSTTGHNHVIDWQSGVRSQNRQGQPWRIGDHASGVAQCREGLP